MKQGKRNWFNIATTAWAIALVLVATTWFAAPAFAGRGGGGDADCTGICADYCGMNGVDCDYSSYGGGVCDVHCDGGLSREIRCET